MGQKKVNFQRLQQQLWAKSWGTVAQLPSCCRPNKILIFNVNNHEGSSRVDVYPNGNIVWKAGGRRHAWLSLSGIVFPLPTKVEERKAVVVMMVVAVILGWLTAAATIHMKTKAS